MEYGGQAPDGVLEETLAHEAESEVHVTLL